MTVWTAFDTSAVTFLRMEHFIFEERGLANTHKKKVMQSFSDQKKKQDSGKKKRHCSTLSLLKNKVILLLLVSYFSVLASVVISGIFMRRIIVLILTQWFSSNKSKNCPMVFIWMVSCKVLVYSSKSYNLHFESKRGRFKHYKQSKFWFWVSVVINFMKFLQEH